ncbi:enoyl-CoA hydratase family protein [Nocardioides sp. DS6]|uniref:Enoyl-CoA hydratase family protein n=1 Tax=Nocardioides eburneus TaxID=3231482 RepID=A0ABV3SZJ1_9ACTN
MTSEATGELVHYDVSEGVATITLDSPHNRNALSQRLVTELFTALQSADKDTAVKVVVLQAAGKVFCAGADLSEAATTGMEEGARTIVRLQRTIVALTKPVVAKVQGPVRAGGLGLVAAADIAVAADTVSFALTEVRLGLAPAAISLTILPRVDARAASYAMLTGEPFDAAKAVEMGLLTQAVPADVLDETVAGIVAALGAGSPQGLRETKRLLVRDLVQHIDARGEDMAHLSARLFGSDEAREAMTAFLTRKK